MINDMCLNVHLQLLNLYRSLDDAFTYLSITSHLFDFAIFVFLFYFTRLKLVLLDSVLSVQHFFDSFIDVYLEFQINEFL